MALLQKSEYNAQEHISVCCLYLEEIGSNPAQIKYEESIKLLLAESWARFINEGACPQQILASLKYENIPPKRASIRSCDHHYV